MPAEKVTLKIPRPLYERIKSVIEPAGFSSVNEFVVYVLRDLMSRVRDETAGAELTSEEIDKIRQRLRNLGYL
ncbi:MAG: CopG family transcriptional regulator [candidate division Zixibacteria bacterium]|nr:CopG family transcriptional regulator [Candidatus Tariuqbacter arcticus]